MEDQKRKEAYHNSRLGQILIKKGYLSPEQLDEAVHFSQSDDKRLGEYLIEHRMISRWQLRRALSSQSQLRLSVSLSMVLLSPLCKDLSSEGAETIDNALEILLKPLLKSAPAAEFEFDPKFSSIEINQNGLIRLRVPSSLGELSFDGLRLKKDETRNYQDLSIADIELTETRLFIRTIHSNPAPALP